ncbi:high mobility group protein 20A [Exaiptasia diaphana]|uniref:HMG box domain-containing protein n=1 Tax=Exaiptasia diaphana TaxID=2652724 RepID=A0A913XTL4_EXADI|nr:high mobility group protein 20A [Exaiptasia diaphana]KXJ09183.1 High mobility group protein 20A [Exaiptasia diaphana]
MDLGVTSELRDQDLEGDGSTSSVLAHVLDVSTNASTVVNSTCYTSGLAVLAPTLDGHATVTSLAGFTLNTFDAVDVKQHGQDHHDLAVATVGVDGRLRFTPASHSTPTEFHHTAQERQNLPTSESDFVSDLSQVEILSGGDGDDRFVSSDDLLHDRQAAVQVAIPDKTPKKKGGWPKGKKRRKTLRDVNAPRAPLTAYVQFLNINREKVRSENPELPFPDVTKLLGAQWSKMTQDQKQKYLDEAERDKERYVAELERYQQTDTYKAFLKKQEERKRKCTEATEGYSNGIELCEEDDLYCKPCNQYFNNLHNKKEHIYGRKHLQTVNGKTGEGNEEDDLPSFNIPIFTEEFLDHNKVKENELRQLRKTATEYEDQNSILSKHIEEMKQGLEKIQVESNTQRTTNELLQQHLYSLRTVLTLGFQDLRLPSTGELPSDDCIDNYMTKLYSLILDSPQENEGLIGNVREIVSRLCFQNDDKILTPT